MVSGVTPGGTPYRPEEPSGTSNQQAILQQMEEFQAEIRADMGPPENEAALKELLPKMEQFLEQNKTVLEQMMQKNGYPMNGTYSITAEFEGAVSSINNYLNDPNKYSLELLNESVTQMNFYLNNKHP